MSVVSSGRRTRWVTLQFDVQFVADPSPAGRYAFFRKDFLLRAREPQAIEVRYDWAAAATIVLDDLTLAADVFVRGPCDRSGPYFVSTALLTREGALIERLTLRQRLPS
jgi:hypothetical protein